MTLRFSSYTVCGTLTRTNSRLPFLRPQHDFLFLIRQQYLQGSKCQTSILLKIFLTTRTSRQESIRKNGIFDGWDQDLFEVGQFERSRLQLFQVFILRFLIWFWVFCYKVSESQIQVIFLSEDNYYTGYKMNYLKQLLQEFHFNESSSQQNSDKSPQESGEFQVIEFDEDTIAELNDPDSTNSKKTNQNLINPLNKKIKLINQPPQFNHQLSNQQLAQKASKEYTIIEIEPLQNDLQLLCQRRASTVQIDEYYMIVDSEELNKKFELQSEWQSFYQKVHHFNQENFNKNASLHSSIHQSQSGKKQNKISLSFKELNSILEIRPQHIQRRQQYWKSIAYPQICIKFKNLQLANKKDPKKLLQNVTKIINNLVPTILSKIYVKKQKPIDSIEDQIQRWKTNIIKILTLYGANDKQIGYSKGLQYIALGILVARPFLNINNDRQSQQNGSDQIKIQDIQAYQKSNQFQLGKADKLNQKYMDLERNFQYLMFIKQLRQMYFPGTPKLYEQIQNLMQLMSAQIPIIYYQLQEIKVDFIKLFINYYKTFLMYKIINPEVIRKLMELLIVYGIELVKIIVIRIMKKQQKKIMTMIVKETETLKYIARDLVSDYFGDAGFDDTLLKFKQLFIVDEIQ